jgi:uncharacterized protein (TIGR03067 family)
MRSLPFYSAILSLVILPMGKGDEPKHSERVDGTWLGSKAELDGKPFPEELTRTIQITVAKGKYKVAVSGTFEEGTFKLNPSTTPKSLDLIGTNGPNEGKLLLAIYELDGDTLKVCYDFTG